MAQITASGGGSVRPDAVWHGELNADSRGRLERLGSALPASCHT